MLLLIAPKETLFFSINYPTVVGIKYFYMSATFSGTKDDNNGIPNIK